MRVADFNHEDFDASRATQQDETLLVKFFTKSVEDKGATKDQGRPIFKEVEYIDIKVPGSRDGACRPATHRDKQRFPRHYAAFKQRVELPSEGTPLVEWGVMSRSMADTLAFANVKTVEDLANMPDNLATQIMNGLSFKQKAKDWLEKAKEDVTVEKLEEELKLRDEKLAELEAKLEEVLANANKPKRASKRANESSGGGGGAGSGS